MDTLLYSLRTARCIRRGLPKLGKPTTPTYLVGQLNSRFSKNWKAQGSPRYVPRVQPDVSGVRDRGSVQDKIPHLPGSRLGSVRYTDSVRGARTEDVTAVGRGQSMAVDTQLEPSSCTIRSSAAPSSVHGGSSLASNRRLDANGHQGEFVSWVQAGPTQSTSQRAPPSHARRTHDDLFAARRLHTPYSRPRGSSSFPYHPFEAHDSPSDTQTQRESIASSSSHVFPGTPDCEIPMSVAQATVANWYFPPPEEIERLIIDAQRQMQPNNRSQQS